MTDNSTQNDETNIAKENTKFNKEKKREYNLKRGGYIYSNDGKIDVKTK